MKRSGGIVVTGRFAEQHGPQTISPKSAPGNGHGVGDATADVLRSVRETWAAGRDFARRCASEGLADKAYRR